MKNTLNLLTPKEFLEIIIKHLVNHPEKVVVKEVKGEKTVILELIVDKEDAPLVIGKGGSMINMIRQLVQIYGKKLGLRIQIEALI